MARRRRHGNGQGTQPQSLTLEASMKDLTLHNNGKKQASASHDQDNYLDYADYEDHNTQHAGVQAANPSRGQRGRGRGGRTFSNSLGRTSSSHTLRQAQAAPQNKLHSVRGAKNPAGNFQRSGGGTASTAVGRPSALPTHRWQSHRFGNVQCSYCNQRNLATLVKCMQKDCQKWFCNGHTAGDNGSQRESHIITHLRAARHHEIAAEHLTEQSGARPYIMRFHCAGTDCTECDAFDLGMDTVQDGRHPEKHFCGHCAIKLRKITPQRRPFIDVHHASLTCISEAIIKVPSHQDQWGCKKITQSAIAELERKWLIEATGIALPGKNDAADGLTKQDTFSSHEEYFDLFEELVELDLALAGMECATIPILKNMIVTDCDTGHVAEWFEFETRSRIHKRELKAGQPILVHMRKWENSITPEPSEATVKFSRETNNVSKIHVRFPVKNGACGEVLMVGQLVDIEVAFQDTAFKRQLEALDRFVESAMSPALQDYVLGKPQPSPRQWEQSRMLYRKPGSKLNSSQEAAVCQVMVSPFSLIQGPPGTGKTHTIVAIVLNVLRQDHTVRVLCCAPSNDPTDHLAVKLSESGIKVLRVTSGRIETDSLPMDLRQLTLRYQLEQLLGRGYEQNVEKGRIARETRNIVEGSQVVCTTCNTAVAHALNSWPALGGVLIIDEATQATEADALIPITKGFAKIVMIGDHKQLGVVTRNRELEKTNLGSSLFERLIRLKQTPSIMLDTQYRMHPVICAPASQIMYEGLLRTGDDVAGIREATGDSLRFLHTLPQFAPLVMIDLAHLHELASDRVSTVNPREAVIVTLCLVNLLHRNVKPEDIGVITFYNGQKDFLKKTMASHSCIPQSVIKRLMIDSVDAFQGRERDYIVLSCVRSGDAGTTSIGFLQDERRLNVALTRAKKGILAVGDRTLLKTSRIWRRFLKDYLHIGADVALQRLGVSRSDHPNCTFCENPSKCSSRLLEPIPAQTIASPVSFNHVYVPQSSYVPSPPSLGASGTSTQPQPWLSVPNPARREAPSPYVYSAPGLSSSSYARTAKKSSRCCIV